MKENQRNADGKFEAHVGVNWNQYTCETEIIAEVYYYEAQGSFSRQYEYGNTPAEARDALIASLYDEFAADVIFPQFEAGGTWHGREHITAEEI